MKRYSFSKSKRIAGNEQFKCILARNRCARDAVLTVFIAENNLGYGRLGISIGKAFGNAVRRNRFKRLVRETFRQCQDQIPAGFDYLVMPSPNWSKKMVAAQADRRGSKSPRFENVMNSFLSLVRGLVGAAPISKTRIVKDKTV
jgi:ribonuclease P protein component